VRNNRVFSLKSHLWQLFSEPVSDIIHVSMVGIQRNLLFGGRVFIVMDAVNTRFDMMAGNIMTKKRCIFQFDPEWLVSSQ